MPQAQAGAQISASEQIAPGVILNSDINSAAAIAYSKLNLGTSIVNADVATSAAIVLSKLAAGTKGGIPSTDGSTRQDLAVGTNAQVLTADSGENLGMKWAGALGKEVVSNSATWTTTFTTTSTTYVDVTNATVTVTGLTSGSTYDLVAIAVYQARHQTDTTRLFISMNIDATDSADVKTGSNSEIPCASAGRKAGVTGSTSYVAKLQAKVASGTGEINTSTTDTMTIILIAIEQ